MSTTGKISWLVKAKEQNKRKWYSVPKITWGLSLDSAHQKTWILRNLSAKTSKTTWVRFLRINSHSKHSLLLDNSMYNMSQENQQFFYSVISVNNYWTTKATDSCGIGIFFLIDSFKFDLNLFLFHWEAATLFWATTVAISSSIPLWVWGWLHSTSAVEWHCPDTCWRDQTTNPKNEGLAVNIYLAGHSEIDYSGVMFCGWETLCPLLIIPATVDAQMF